MPKDDRLQLAISKARAGYELGARDLFISIVEDDPNNKIAWLWLIGLLDDREDLIIACEEVLRIDPMEKHVRNRLSRLRVERVIEEERWTKDALQEVHQLLEQGEKEIALTRLRKIVQENRDAGLAWSLIAEHSPDLREQVKAL